MARVEHGEKRIALLGEKGRGRDERLWCEDRAGPPRSEREEQLRRDPRRAQRVPHQLGHAERHQPGRLDAPGRAREERLQGLRLIRGRAGTAVLREPLELPTC